MNTDFAMSLGILPLSYKCKYLERERERQRQTDRQSDSQTVRQTDRQRDKGGRTDRQTDKGGRTTTESKRTGARKKSLTCYNYAMIYVLVGIQSVRQD